MRLVFAWSFAWSWLAGCGGNDAATPCAGIDCSDHGRCVPEGSSATCVCDDGFSAVGLTCVEDGGSDSDSDSDTGSDTCDEDGDGHEAVACAGDDCDDRTSEVAPGLPDNADLGWVIESIDFGGPTGAIAVGDDGIVYVAYQDAGDVLAVAHRTDGEWQIRSFNGARDGGVDPAIAVGRDGSIHVVAGLSGPQEFRYTSDAIDWEVETIDSTTGPPVQAGVVGGADGTVYVTYRDDFGTQGYAIRDPEGNWAIDPQDQFDSGMDQGCIAMQPDGSVRLGIIADGRLYVYEPGGIGGPIDDAFPAPTSLGYDDASRPHVVFSESPDNRVAYRVQNASWDLQVVDDLPGSGAHTGLAVQPDGTAHVVYVDPTTGAIRYAQSVAGGAIGDFTKETIDSSGDGADPEIAYGVGALHVTYGDVNTQEQKYARRGLPDGVDQNCDGVDGLDGDTDGYASLATGGTDCDDTLATTHPGAADPAGGEDEDCDGALD